MRLKNIYEYPKGEFEEINLEDIDEIVKERLESLESGPEFVTSTAKIFEIVDKPGYFVKVLIARDEGDL